MDAERLHIEHLNESIVSRDGRIAELEKALTEANNVSNKLKNNNFNFTHFRLPSMTKKMCKNLHYKYQIKRLKKQT
jgi:hypothetical protein